jgi:hypothetical protein
MKSLSIIFTLLLGLSVSGCAATKPAKTKKSIAPVEIKVETIPQGYLLKDEKGVTWLLTVSTDGRVVMWKVDQR